MNTLQYNQENKQLSQTFELGYGRTVNVSNICVYRKGKPNRYEKKMATKLFGDVFKRAKAADRLREKLIRKLAASIIQTAWRRYQSQ